MTALNNKRVFLKQLEEMQSNPIKIPTIDYTVENVEYKQDSIIMSIRFYEEINKGNDDICYIHNVISNIIIPNTFPFRGPFLQFAQIMREDCDENVVYLKDRNKSINHDNQLKMHNKISDLERSWKPGTKLRNFIPKVIKLFRKIIHELVGVTSSRGAVSLLFDDYLVRGDDTKGNMPGATKNAEIFYGQPLRANNHLGRRIQAFLGEGGKKKKRRKTKKRTRRKKKTKKRKRKRKTKRRKKRKR